mgnify:CR=1 FL=1
MKKGDLPTKVCPVCQRPFAWRKKWERDWDQVRYCSTSCRHRGVTEVDERLDDIIAFSGIEGLGISETICAPCSPACAAGAARSKPPATRDARRTRWPRRPWRRAARH